MIEIDLVKLPKDTNMSTVGIVVIVVGGVLVGTMLARLVFAECQANCGLASRSHSNNETNDEPEDQIDIEFQEAVIERNNARIVNGGHAV